MYRNVLRVLTLFMLSLAVVAGMIVAQGGAAPGQGPGGGQGRGGAIIFHDIENSSNRGTADTLHWMAWDFPGKLKSIPEGLAMGDLADGTKQSTTAIGRGRYFGPGAGAGPYHHYVFEFYALDTKLNLPNTATRAEVLAAMEGHVIGKAAYTGRFHQ